MSGSWQQCLDTASGQPYYWNTRTNQVSWECPQEVSLPPPQLLTKISLARPVSRETSPGLPPSSLVSGYDSEDSAEDESRDKQSGVAQAQSQDSHGKVKQRLNERDLKKSSEDRDDILSLIEAEKPPDYSDSRAKLPSCKSNSREPSEAHQPRSLLVLANYDDSDQSEEEGREEVKTEKKMTSLDQNGRMVFSESDWRTEEQREALLSYRTEEQRIDCAKRSERSETDSVRRFDNSIPGSRKRRLDLPKGKFNKTEKARLAAEEEEAEENNKPEMNFVPFVKSSSGLAGTIERDVTNNELQKPDNTPQNTEIKGNH